MGVAEKGRPDFIRERRFGHFPPISAGLVRAVVNEAEHAVVRLNIKCGDIYVEYLSKGYPAVPGRSFDGGEP